MSEVETSFYLDTSALLPYYRNEPMSPLVQQFLSSCTQPVHISLLTEVELTSALARIVRMRELDEIHAVRINELFERERKAGFFRRMPVSTAHYKQAKTWLTFGRTALRTLDALHLACSHAIQAEMVTADRTLHAAARQLDVRCRLLA